MGTSVTVTCETGIAKYPTAEATFIGTNIARYWNDPHLYTSLFQAVGLAGEDKDIFDFSNFLFSQINNTIRRRYGGQELQLDCVLVTGNDGVKVESYA